MAGQRFTVGLGSGISLLSAAAIQLTDVNRLLLLMILGAGAFVVCWELAPYARRYLVGKAKPQDSRRMIVPILMMISGVAIFLAGAVLYPTSDSRSKTQKTTTDKGNKIGNIESNNGIITQGQTGDNKISPK